MCQYLAKIESYDPVVVPLWWQYNFGVVHFTEHVRWNPPYGNNGTIGHGYSLSPDRTEQYSIRLEKRFCVSAAVQGMSYRYFITRKSNTIEKVGKFGWLGLEESWA